MYETKNTSTSNKLQKHMCRAYSLCDVSTICMENGISDIRYIHPVQELPLVVPFV